MLMPIRNPKENSSNGTNQTDRPNDAIKKDQPPELVGPKSNKIYNNYSVWKWIRKMFSLQLIKKLFSRNSYKMQSLFLKGCLNTSAESIPRPVSFLLYPTHFQSKVPRVIMIMNCHIFSFLFSSDSALSQQRPEPPCLNTSALAPALPKSTVATHFLYTHPFSPSLSTPRYQLLLYSSFPTDCLLCQGHSLLPLPRFLIPQASSALLAESTGERNISVTRYNGALHFSWGSHSTPVKTRPQHNIYWRQLSPIFIYKMLRVSTPSSPFFSKPKTTHCVL